MRVAIILAAGIWIGREIFTAVSRNQAREREIQIRKKLEQFIRENLPTLQIKEMQAQIENILK